MKGITLRKIMVVSLLATLPLGFANAKKVSFENGSHDISVGANPEELEDTDNYRIDAEGNVELVLPAGFSTQLDYRFSKTVDETGDVDINKEFFWETVEGLVIKKKIGVTVEIGKIKDPGFGTAMNGIGGTALINYLDDVINSGNLDLRGKTGIKVTAFDDLIQSEKRVMNILSKMLSGVTVTFFDTNSQHKPEFDSFKELKGYAVQKTGEAMGIRYQASYIKNDTEDVRDRRWDVSADYCLAKVCFGGEYLNLENSDLSPIESRTRATVTVPVGERNRVGVQVEKNKAKAGQEESAQGDTVRGIWERRSGRLSYGASVGYDLDNESKEYGAHVNVGLGDSKRTESNLLPEMTARTKSRNAERQEAARRASERRPNN